MQDPEELAAQLRAGVNASVLANLNGVDLHGADLHDANLSEANLFGANLSGSNLFGANLFGASLGEADLGRAILRKANLGEANLRDSKLKKADLGLAYLSRAKLSGADLSGADLHSAKLREALLSQANLLGVNLGGADLSGADLGGADLSGANLQQAILIEANAVGAKLFGGNLFETYFDEANLQSADLRYVNFYRANLSGANLLGADLRYANLHRANLDGVKLLGADLRETTITNTKLPRSITAARSLSGAGMDWRTIALSLTLDGLQSTLARTGMPDVAALYLIESLRSIDEMDLFTMLQSVFLSYGGPDETFADRLRQTLTTNGVKTWYYPRDAVPGSRHHRHLQAQIHAYDRMVLCCSKASLQREGVLHEVEEALEREQDEGGSEVMIPVLLESIFDTGKPPPPWWPEGKEHVYLALRRRVGADFRGAMDDENKWNEQVARVLKALRKRPDK